MAGKKRGQSLSQDLDIFGDIENTVGEEVSNDLFGVDDKTEVTAEELLGEVDTPEVKPETEEVKVEEEVKPEVKEEPKAEDKKVEETKTEEATPGEEGDDAEFKKLVDDILNSTEEVDVKVEEIKQQAADDNNKELLDLVDSLQSMLTEKNLQIEELKKSNEVVSGKYLDRYADSEGLMIHKDVVDKLEGDPKLMMLVKYSDSDNEKIKDRVLNILTDMIYKQTGQDVGELLDNAQKDSVTAILGTPDSQVSLDTPAPKVDDKDMTFEESTQNLF